MSSSTRACAAVSAAVIVMIAGCNGRPTVATGVRCELNNECAAPLVCRLGRCRTECRSERDCPAERDCVRDPRGLGSCTLQDEECELNNECPDFLVCRFQRCVNICETDRDCAPGTLCEDEPGEGRGCQDVATKECLRNSDCFDPRMPDLPMICGNDERCRVECIERRDCRDGNWCNSGVCGPMLPDGGAMDAGGVDAAGVDAGMTDSGVRDAGSDSGVDGGVAAAPTLLGSGFKHACALVAGMDLRCWGLNDEGQIGIGSIGVNQPTPQPLPTLVGVTHITAGIDHTCAASSAGLHCWGRNDVGQVLPGSTTRQGMPQIVGLPAGAIVSLAAGESHTCAVIDSPRRLFCWGSNGDGQLGIGSPGPAPVPPTEVSLLGAPAAVAAYTFHTCVLLTDGQIQCFGNNFIGQIGIGNTISPQPTPMTVPGISDARQIAVGGTFTCVLRSDQSVWCWGDRSVGQLGDGVNVMARPNPAMVPLPPLVMADEIATGSSHSCARAGAELYCWGENRDGQCGRTTGGVQATPSLATAVASAEAVVAGSEQTCIRVGGTNHECFGANDVGQLGNTMTSGTPSHIPVTVAW